MFKLIKRQKSYALVILILGLLLANSFFRLFYREEPEVAIADSGHIIIPSEGTSFKTGIPQTFKGKYYRLFFEARAYSENKLNTPDFERISIDHSSKIKIILKSNYGEKKFVKEFEIDNSLIYKSHEAIILMDSNYTELIFEKVDKYDSNVIFQRGMFFHELNVSDQKSADLVRPVIKPATILDWPIAEFVEESPVAVHRFNGTGNLVGQIFKAESDRMSGVSFKFDLKGKGGLGSYKAELRKAEFANGKYIISPETISSFEFHSYDYAPYLNDEGEWRLPLAAILEKGQYYFVGISDREASVNFFNYANILGSSEMKNKIPSLLIDTTGETKEIGSLYFKIFGAAYTRVGDERILEGTIIEDVGSGTGYFTYNSVGDITDLLNLDKFDLGENNQGKVFYLGKANTVVGTAQFGTSFTYRFNMMHPIKDVIVSASQIGPIYFKNKLFYSFDGVNWQQITEEQDNSDDGWKADNTLQQYVQKIVATSKSNQFYIKVTYDENDNGREEGLFGVRNLSLLAEIDMSK